MEPVFRVADCADIDPLLQFMREYYEFDHLPFDAVVARGALEKFVADDSLGRVWVITYNGEDVGYVALTLGYSLEYGGRDAFIDEVYIREHYRGRGLGRQTLEFIDSICRSLGVRALHLEVERENVHAYGVYRQAGFIDHERYLLTKIFA